MSITVLLEHLDYLCPLILCVANQLHFSVGRCSNKQLAYVNLLRTLLSSWCINWLCSQAFVLQSSKFLVISLYGARFDAVNVIMAYKPYVCMHMCNSYLAMYYSQNFYKLQNKDTIIIHR